MDVRVDCPRVVVRATDLLTQTGLVTHLRGRDEIRVVAGRQSTNADVVLLAADRVTGAGVGAMRAAVESCHAPAVLLANRVDDDLDALSEHRVVSLLFRDATDIGSLVRMVVDVARQGVVDGGEVQRRLRLRADPPGGDHSGLLGGPSEPVMTPREIEVLRLIADGWETSAIAGELCYAERTVKNIIHGITSRLNFRNRTQAVAHALRTGLI